MIVYLIFNDRSPVCINLEVVVVPGRIYVVGTHSLSS